MPATRRAALALLVLASTLSSGAAFASSLADLDHQILTSVAIKARPAIKGATPASVVPRLVWNPCPQGAPNTPPSTGVMDCAIAELPLDYDEPSEARIGVALMRRRASDPSRRIGTLFVNPGGPGGSGVDLVPFLELIFPAELLARFDVIGFDPRGVARSAPLVCFPNPEAGFGLLGSLPPFPMTLREDASFVSTIQRSLNEECDRHAGPIINHMSTANVARDLDVLRSAVGDTQLSYIGLSYGSQLGTTYANMFPQRVRAMVLDGTIDPIAWTTGASRGEGLTVPVTTRVGSAHSAHATLERFFDKCRDAGADRCALAAHDPAQRYERLATRLRRDAISVDLGGGAVNFTYAHLVAMTLSALQDPYTWSEFAAFVEALANGTDGEVMRRTYARVERSIVAQDSAYQSQSIEGFPGVICTDSTNPAVPARWSVAGRREDERSPYFGRLWTWRSIPCATWPGHDEDRYTGPWRAQTANPVLVVGSLYDPATPYAGAQRVEGLLEGSRLLTLDGEGHVSRGLSTCVNNAEVDYLLNLTLPPKGTVCQTDVEPFPSTHGASPNAHEQALDEARRVLLAATRAGGWTGDVRPMAASVPDDAWSRD